MSGPSLTYTYALRITRHTENQSHGNEIRIEAVSVFAAIEQYADEIATLAERTVSASQTSDGNYRVRVEASRNLPGWVDTVEVFEII